MMVFGEEYDNTIEVTPKEKIDVIAKETTTLDEIFTKLERHKLDSPNDIKELKIKVEHIYFAYQNIFNEINYDVMELVKDAPNYKEFFNLLNHGNAETDEEKLGRWMNFKAKRSGELSDRIVRLVPLLAKMMAITAMLQNIYYKTGQRIAEYAISGSAVPQEEPGPSKDVSPELMESMNVVPFSMASPNIPEEWKEEEKNNEPPVEPIPVPTKSPKPARQRKSWHITTEDKEKAKEMFKNGKTENEVATELMISSGSAHNLRKETLNVQQQG